MKKWLLSLGFVLAMAVGLEATLSVPNTFVPFTTISSSQMNANFSAITSNGLDKRGDTLSGTLNTQVLLPDVTATRNIGSATVLYLNEWLSGTLTAGSITLSGALGGATTGAFSGNVTIGGTLGVTGTSTLGSLTVTGLSGLSSLTLTTPLAIASGGTNGSATPTSGGVAFGNGSAYAFSSAGTAGQYLVSAGTGTPVWGGRTASFNAGNSTSAITLNFATNGLVQQVTRTASTTITLSPPQLAQTVVVLLQHDATGTTYTVAFSPAVKWPNGTAPTFSQTASAIDIITLYWDGTNWYGVGQVAFA